MISSSFPLVMLIRIVPTSVITRHAPIIRIISFWFSWFICLFVHSIHGLWRIGSYLCFLLSIQYNWVVVKGYCFFLELALVGIEPTSINKSCHISKKNNLSSLNNILRKKKINSLLLFLSKPSSSHEHEENSRKQEYERDREYPNNCTHTHTYILLLFHSSYYHNQKIQLIIHSKISWRYSPKRFVDAWNRTRGEHTQHTHTTQNTPTSLHTIKL